MATVYKVEIVSHWIDYTEETLEQKLQEAVKNLDINGNVIQVSVLERQ